MLKKAGIAVAVAAVGVLALAPFALADDQDNTQTSTQGEGELNGHNYESGLAEQLVCGDHDLSLPSPSGGDVLTQSGGECTNTSVQKDQVEKQKQWEH